MFKLNGSEDDMPLDILVGEALDVYRSIPDNIKIICSYSGGKDSTTMAILLCIAIEKGFVNADRLLFVYADTFLEMPNLHQFAINFLNFINNKYGVQTQIVEPEVKNSFWVRFLGEGTIASNPIARWCVKPLKVKPIKDFFQTQIKENEEYIVAVGIRLDESSTREEKYKDVSAIPEYSCDTQGECFAPLEDEKRAFPLLNWKNCNIWDFLQFNEYSYQFPVEKLREIYLHRDNARYGCWNCTVVGLGSHIVDGRVLGEDFTGLVEWRELQYEYRFAEKSKYPEDWVYILREEGKYKGQYKPSRITVKARKKLLSKLLSIQEEIRSKGHEITLIQDEEIKLIKEWWTKRPDGDIKGRKWKYYHEIQTSLNQFFDEVSN